MIKLENIIVEALTNGLSYPGISTIIEENRIKTLADFFGALDKIPNIDWRDIDRRMSLIFKEMEKYNAKGKEPVTFPIKEYSDSSLEATDYKNKGNVLILDSPTKKVTTTFSVIRNERIELIKRQISLTISNGDNALISCVNKIGLLNLQILMRALDMYTEQVERQAQLTDKRDINLFEFELPERKRIIEKLIAEILAYFIHNAKELTWDELTDYKMGFYESALTKDFTTEAMLKERIIEMIAGYTTLPEVEELENGDYQVLKRFIVK